MFLPLDVKTGENFAVVDGLFNLQWTVHNRQNLANCQLPVAN
jgi:hypothetical protein